MADLIRIKGGRGTTPTLQDRELAYNKDEQALYIGTENGNVMLCLASDLSGINTKLDEIIARLDALAPTEAQTE